MTNGRSHPSLFARILGPVIFFSILGAFAWFITGRFTLDLIVETFGAAAAAYITLGWLLVRAE